MALLRVVDRDGVEHEVDAKPGLKVMETLRELDYGVAESKALLEWAGTAERDLALTSTKKEGVRRK